MDVMLSSSGDVFTLGGVEGKSGHVSLVEIMALAGRPRPLRYTACNGGSLFRPPGISTDPPVRVAVLCMSIRGMATADRRVRLFALRQLCVDCAIRCTTRRLVPMGAAG